MAQALRQTHHEQVHGGLSVEECQRTQHGGEAGVVRAGTYQAHGKNGIVGYVDVGVVGILVEDVDDGQLRVGDGAKSDGEGNGSSNSRFTVATLFTTKKSIVRIAVGCKCIKYVCCIGVGICP